MIEILKSRPDQLWHCNTMRLNGCAIYCTEYRKGQHWTECKQHKKLCKPFEQKQFGMHFMASMANATKQRKTINIPKHPERN